MRPEKDAIHWLERSLSDGEWSSLGEEYKRDTQLKLDQLRWSNMDDFER